MDSNPHNQKRKAWALAELKETYIQVFQKFIEARFNWTRALSGVEDPHITKIAYVAALDAYYQVSQAVFNQHLKESCKDKPEEYQRIKSMYQDLGFRGLQMDDETLYKLGNYINEWNTLDGFMQLNETIQTFTDPIQAVKYFEDIR